LAYGLGKLDDRRTESIESHLENCADCSSYVASISCDGFIAHFRRTRTDDSDARRPTSVTEELHRSSLSAPAAHPAPSMALPPELASLSRYQVLGELGRGGMGVVFLARNRLMDRDEALKLLEPKLVNHPGMLERLMDEIRAVARLQHPNIIATYGAFPCGKSVVLAMEYVEGHDLGQVVRLRGPLRVMSACYDIHQAAQALQHAHEQGLVHRGIRPGNLMLAQVGNRPLIKVLNFGLAKANLENNLINFHHVDAMREGKSGGTLSLEGRELGITDFIAPEQISDFRKADIRADIYSLGCTFHYLLTGHPPFQASSMSDLLQAHHSMDPPRLNLVRPEVPVELAALAVKMMAKDPEQRFQTPAEVGRALAPLLQQKGCRW
jgi:serine/threonine protein kinase